MQRVGALDDGVHPSTTNGNNRGRRRLTGFGRVNVSLLKHFQLHRLVRERFKPKSMIVERETFERAAVVGWPCDDWPLPSWSAFSLPRSWEGQERNCRQGVLGKREQGKWINAEGVAGKRVQARASGSPSSTTPPELHDEEAGSDLVGTGLRKARPPYCQPYAEDDAWAVAYNTGHGKWC
jgi:hypothetical protein